MTEYKAYIDPGKDLPINEEIEIEVIDQETFEQYWVKAVMSPWEEEREASKLWLYEEGRYEARKDNPWAIRIIERIEEGIELAASGGYAGSSCPTNSVGMVKRKEPEIRIGSKERISSGKRGDLLKTLIKEREEDGGS